MHVCIQEVWLQLYFIYLFFYISELAFRASPPSHTRVCHPLSCNTSSNWERHSSGAAGIAWVRIQRGITAESSNKRQGGGEDEGMRSARDNGATEKTQGFCMRSDWRSRRMQRVSQRTASKTASQQTASVCDCETNDPALFLADETEERGGDDWQPPRLTAVLLAAASASPNYKHVFP